MKRISGAGLVLLTGLFLYTGCSSSMTEEIEVSKNKIASFYKAVGAKEIVHTELTYKEGEISEKELTEYIAYLTEEEDFATVSSPTVPANQTAVRLEKVTESTTVSVTLIYQTSTIGEVTMIYSSNDYDKKE